MSDTTTLKRPTEDALRSAGGWMAAIATSSRCAGW
jgi:hypothetical protein